MVPLRSDSGAPDGLAASAARLVVHPLGFVHLTWLPGSSSSSAFRATFEQLLAQLEHHAYAKALIDQRWMAQPTDEDCTWYLLDWLPRATRHRYRYGALLPPYDLFGRASTQGVVRQAVAHYPLVYHYFEREPCAIEWLLAQPAR